MKVYDFEYFENIINHSRLESTGDLCSIAKNCVLRVSFVKGWGENYARYIDETPIWLEIQITSPLKLLKFKYDPFVV